MAKNPEPPRGRYTPPKIQVKPLRMLPGIHAHAGALAKAHDVEWWAAWGYAASMAGATDATELQEVAIEWLQGWARQWKLDNPSHLFPEQLTWLIEHGTRPI